MAKIINQNWLNSFAKQPFDGLLVITFTISSAEDKH